MKSTCEDVKRLLNVSACKLPKETYDLGSEKVTITFSTSRCFQVFQKWWNVPVGTVVMIERDLTKPISISELGIPREKYKISETDAVDLNVYDSEEEGVSFEAFKDWVQHIAYVPTKTDARQLALSAGKC